MANSFMIMLLRTFLLFLLLAKGYSQRCPHEWKDRPGGNSCYFFGVGIPRRSWFSARSFCQSSQADLLKMNDVPEKNWVIQQIAQLDKTYPGPQEFWVGLNARDNFTVWKWADGDVADMDLIRWGSGEPSNPVAEQCAEIWDNLFNDKDCRTPIEFVCERSKDIPLTCDIDMGWQYYGGSCYKFKPAFRTFLQAREECQKQEADLVPVMSEEVQKTVRHLVTMNDNQDSWIGINMYQKKFKFVNGSFFTPSTQTYWQPSAKLSPDSDVESCVAVNGTAKSDSSWYTDLCTNGKSFTCVKPEGVCDPAYDQHQSRCFQLVYTNRTWRDAYDYCRDKGARLVDIRRASDQLFITSYLNKRANEIDKVWISLSRKENDQWTWTLNEFDQPTYFNWDTGEDLRTSAAGVCAYMDAGDQTGKWRSDTPCSQSAAFVCVTDVIKSKPETTTQNTVRTAASTSGSSGQATPRPKPVTQSPTTTTTTSAPSARGVKCGFWEENPNSDYCYQFNARKLTWLEADENCVLGGGRLLSITSIQEQYFLAGRIRGMTSGSLWIGANSRGESRGWHWSDGSPFKYIHWQQGQPDNLDNSEECVVMSERTSKWSDETCDQTHGYICKKLGVTKITPPPVPTTVVIPDGQMYGCPESWVEYLDSCFLVSRQKMTWSKAQEFCRGEGGDLTSIRNEDEQNYLFSQIPKSHCYNIYTNDSHCTTWAEAGECSKNPIWMARNCHLGCNLCIRDCKDLYKGQGDFCRRWAENGECDKNPSWMMKNCAFSCGICDSAIHGGFWIGLNDRIFQNSFTWSDEADVTYTTWMVNEPNNYGTHKEDCVSMNLRTGKWSDVNCGRTLPGFICRKSKQIMPRASISPLTVGCVNDSIGYSAMCYQFNNDELSFNGSENFCQTYGGHLATINNRYVQAFISSQLVNKEGGYWIGLSDEKNPGTLSKWNSGSSVEFTHWAQGYTGDDRGMCVYLHTTHPIGLWSKSNCTSENKFICEYPRQGFTTTTTTTQPTTTLEPPTCAAGWSESASGYCFKTFVDPKRTWIESRDYCRQLGGDLASIHNNQEAQVINRIMQSKWSTYWIGINDRDIESGFTWSDRTPIDYVNWIRGEPNNMHNNQDCGQGMSWSQQWDDNNCYIKQPFVCKIKKGLDVQQVNESTDEWSQCGEDEKWMYHNGYCYYMYDKTIDRNGSKTWYDARKYCQRNGSELTSVHSMDEANFLMTLMTTNSNLYSTKWIGLNEIDLENGYRWSDGTPLDYIHWANREPSDSTGGERCVMLMHGRWYDVNCNNKLSGFICKKRNGTTVNLSPSPPPTPLIPAGCPPKFFSVPVSNKCFYFNSKSKLDWISAKRACTNLGKGIQLASVSSDMEMKFLVVLMKDQPRTYSYWIGLHEDKGERGHYIWEDNSIVKFVNWAPNEPNGEYEQCVEMYGPGKRTGLWNDAPCYATKGYICQGERNPEFPIPTAPFSCPEGFQQFETSCYKLLPAADSWDGANTHCRILGGSIASIISVYEQTFVDYITTSIRNKFFYIGLKRSSNSDVSTSAKPLDFYWVDNWPMLYMNWGENQPSMKGDCVVVKNSKWMDAACDVNIPALCEINKSEPPTTPIPGICPSGTSAYNKKCYYVERTRTSWSNAQRKCKTRGMELTSIADVDESNYVLGLVGRNQRIRMWIGLRRTTDGLGFKWSDGTPVDYVSWNSGEPSDSLHSYDEMCTEMHENGGWNDINCNNYNLLYVCKGNEIYITQPVTTEMTTAETTDTETTEITTTESLTTTTTQITYNETTTTIPTMPQVSTQLPGNVDVTNYTTPTTTKRSPGRYIPRRRYVHIKANEKTSLSAGEIVGILIGIIGIITIAGAVYFVIKLHIERSNSYNTKEHGFTNALYLKSGENVSLSEDNNFAGSTVKLCEKSV